jgi:hypothetical protein
MTTIAFGNFVDGLASSEADDGDGAGRGADDAVGVLEDEQAERIPPRSRNVAAVAVARRRRIGHPSPPAPRTPPSGASL